MHLCECVRVIHTVYTSKSKRITKKIWLGSRLLNHHSLSITSPARVGSDSWTVSTLCNLVRMNSFCVCKLCIRKLPINAVNLLLNDIWSCDEYSCLCLEHCFYGSGIRFGIGRRSNSVKKKLHLKIHVKSSNFMKTNRT